MIFSRTERVSVLLLLINLVAPTLSLSPHFHFDIAARLENDVAMKGISLQPRTTKFSAQRKREGSVSLGTRRILQQTSTVTESMKCGWYDHLDYSYEHSCRSFRDMDVESECGSLDWSCAGSGSTCTLTMSTAYIKCALDHLYAPFDGVTPVSSFVTCEVYESTSKQKSSTYHGEIAEDQCNMDDDIFEVHEQTFCGSYGPYIVLTLTVVDGGDPLSCTDAFSCDSATISSESISCSVSYGTSGSGSPSSSYSPAPITNSRPPPSGGKYGANSAAAAGGSVFAIFITILVLYYLWRFRRCFQSGNQANERNASHSHNIEMASPAPRIEHQVYPSHIFPGQSPNENIAPVSQPPPNAGASNFCTNCGSPASHGQFCAICGTKL